jgi:microcystin-dependent protein
MIRVKHYAALAAIIAASIIWSAIPPTPVRAQLDASQTWVGASNVGGTANAITLTVPNVHAMSDLVGVPVRFVPASNNAAGGTTINVNSIATVTVKRVTASGLIALGGGDFIASSQAEVIYDGTEYVQQVPSGGLIPPGVEMTFMGTTAALGYIIEDGSCVSQTTYAALYAYLGTTWGGSCGGGTFPVPDMRGRVSAGYDSQGSQGAANRLTNAGSGCAATGVGVGCGAQNQTIAQANLPSVNFTTSISIPASTYNAVVAASTYNAVVAASTYNATIPSSTYQTTIASGYTVNIASGQGSHTHTLPNFNISSDFNPGGSCCAATNGSSFTTAAATLPAMTGTTTTMNGAIPAMNAAIPTMNAAIPSMNAAIPAMTGTGTAASGGSGTALTTIPPLATVIKAIKY